MPLPLSSVQPQLTAPGRLLSQSHAGADCPPPSPAPAQGVRVQRRACALRRGHSHRHPAQAGGGLSSPCWAPETPLLSLPRRSPAGRPGCASASSGASLQTPQSSQQAPVSCLCFKLCVARSRTQASRGRVLVCCRAVAAAVQPSLLVPMPAGQLCGSSCALSCPPFALPPSFLDTPISALYHPPSASERYMCNITRPAMAGRSRQQRAAARCCCTPHRGWHGVRHGRAACHGNGRHILTLR